MTGSSSIARAPVAWCFVASVLSGCASAPPTGAPIPESPVTLPVKYGPFTATYLITSHARVDQEFGGGVNTTEYTMHFYVTTSARGSGDTLALSITLDSIPVLEGQMLEAARDEARRVAGLMFRGTLTGSGEVKDLTSPADTSGPLAQEITRGLERLFPPLPSGGATVGATWTDSTESTNTTQGLDLTFRSVAAYRAESWEAHGGFEALRVGSDATYSVAGAGSTGGVEITLDGSGVRRGRHYLAADGRYLGGVWADTLHSTAMVAAMGTAIPVTTFRADTVLVVR
jgi:hypothetical protein